VTESRARGEAAAIANKKKKEKSPVESGKPAVVAVEGLALAGHQ
jgi:hypothetical protein